MKHPHGRAARRYAREVSRNRRRQQVLNWWGSYISLSQHGRGIHNKIDAAKENGVWLKGGKQCYGHGNRCMCHYEKRDRKHVRQRRRALDMEIQLNIWSWDEQACQTRGPERF